MHRRRLLARARRAAPMRHQHGQVALDLNLALAVGIGRTAPMRHQRGQARQLKSVLTEYRAASVCHQRANVVGCQVTYPNIAASTLYIFSISQTKNSNQMSISNSKAT